MRIGGPLPLTIFLDQSRWVDLHLAGSRPQKPGAKRAVQLLERARERELVRLPLCASHYLETWHRNSGTDRHELAAMMRDLSDFETMAPLEVVTVAELERHCADITGEEEPKVVAGVFGRGVNHAFNSDTGRFVFVESLPASIWAAPGEIATPRFFADIRDMMPDTYEWVSLAGPPDDFDTMPEVFAFETRPEHGRGDEWVKQEKFLRARLDDLGLSNRLRDAILVEDIKGMLDDLNGVAIRYGIDPHALMGEPLVGPRALIAALPSRYTLLELEFARLRDRKYVPKQHDRPDLLSHAVAVLELARSDGQVW